MSNLKSYLLFKYFARNEDLHLFLKCHTPIGCVLQKCVPCFCVPYLISNEQVWLELKLKAPEFFRGLCERTMIFSSSDAGEARTHDQWLKRPLLYQLSYRIKKIKFSESKINIYFFIIIKKFILIHLQNMLYQTLL